MEPALERFVEYLPDKPRYSNESKILGGISSKKTALERGHQIELASHKAHYLAFDLDYPEAGAAWLDVGAPPPTIAVINPNNWHAHLLFELEQPVLLPIHGHWAPWLKPEPIAYYKATRAAGILCLKADAGYTGSCTKNPLHPAWRAYSHDIQYKLRELADAFKLDELAPKAKGNTEAIAYAGRNDELFNEARRWAYREVKDFLRLEFSEFFSAVFKYCNAYNESQFVNHPSGMLNSNSIRSTARSIASWTWCRRHRAWIKEHWKSRGAMRPYWQESIDKTQLTYDEQVRLIKERQSAGAHYTNCNQRRFTQAKIKNAVRRLRNSGKKITKSGVARETGLSRPTVHAYQHLLKS